MAVYNALSHKATTVNQDDRNDSQPVDDRMQMARAYQRATRGVTVAIGMVIPGLIGYWLDSLLGIEPVLTIVGFGGGMAIGIRELIRMGKPKDSAK